MSKKLLGLLLMSALTITVTAQQPAPTPAPAKSAAAPVAPRTHLKVGDVAPDFMLTDTAGKPVKLSDFRGKQQVVLAFYVLAFTGG